MVMASNPENLNAAERARLEAARARAAEINRRERDANFRGLAASMAVGQHRGTPLGQAGRALRTS